MKTSIENLNILIELLGEDWKLRLDSYLKNEEVELSGKGRACIEDFFRSCIEEIKNSESSNLQKVEKKIANDLLYKNLRNYLDSLLWAYYAFSPLRALGAGNSENKNKIIDQVFRHTILRYDPNILQEYDKFGFDNRSSFVDFLNALDSLCSIMIDKNMHYDTMLEFIYMQTRLSKVMCKQLADIVDGNFNELRLNYIIEKLNSLQGLNSQS